MIRLTFSCTGFKITVHEPRNDCDGGMSMNRNGTKDRIHVTPNDPYIYIMITMFVLMAIKSLQDDLLPLSIVLAIATLLMITGYRRRRIIAGSGGIIFYKRWGNTVRIRYSQITRIEVSFWVRGTSMDFFIGKECVGRCYSGDNNFDILLNFLLEKMPERFDFHSSPL